MPSSITKAKNITSSLTKALPDGSNADLGGSTWVNPNLIAVSDSLSTTTIIGSGSRSDWLIANDFNFSIPPQVDILGIQVQITRSNTAVSGGPGTISDSGIRLIDDVGSFIGLSKASGLWTPNTDGIVTYGGSNDVWGANWTPGEINSPKFGVGIAAQNVGAAYGSIIPATGAVNNVSVQVFYAQTNVHNGYGVVLGQKGAVGEIPTLPRGVCSVEPNISGFAQRLDNSFWYTNYYSS